MEPHGCSAAASITFTIGLLLLAAAQGIILYVLAWIAIGAGGAFGLSAPAYTAVVERAGPDSKRVIAILMLFTGAFERNLLADPQPAQRDRRLAPHFSDLRCAAVFRMPAAASFRPAEADRLCRGRQRRTANAGTALPEGQRKAFLLIAAATTISTFITFGVSPSLLEIFPPVRRLAGALALQLGSARGVIGISARFLDMLLGRRGNPILSAAMGVMLMVSSFLLMLAMPPSTPLLISFILLYGFGSGVMTVARALLPLALFSPREYGLQAARLSLPQNLANAIAPVVFTAILDRAGAGTAIATCAMLAVMSLGFVLMLAAQVKAATRLCGQT